MVFNGLLGVEFSRCVTFIEGLELHTKAISKNKNPSYIQSKLLSAGGNSLIEFDKIETAL